MPKNYNTQNAHLGDSSIMVGAIESYSAETAAHEETTSNFFGLSLILIIASVAILLVRRLRRVKTRRAGRSYL
jgi:flagellar biogenesis protein FliO